LIDTTEKDFQPIPLRQTHSCGGCERNAQFVDMQDASCTYLPAENTFGEAAGACAHEEEALVRVRERSLARVERVSELEWREVKIYEGDQCKNGDEIRTRLGGSFRRRSSSKALKT
jgi:hypothetical protein